MRKVGSVGWPEILDRTAHAYTSVVDEYIGTAIDCKCRLRLVF